MGPFFPKIALSLAWVLGWLPMPPARFGGICLPGELSALLPRLHH